MKIGSVVFFKRLIIFAFIFILLAAIAAAIVFGLLYKNQLAAAQNVPQAPPAQTLPAQARVQEPRPLPPTPEYAALPQQAQDVTIPPSFAYQTLYPHMYAETGQPVATEGKVCYLTFDDGPSQVTSQLLNTLEEYGIKATFFVTGENSEINEDVLRAAANAGHTIGVHSYSHSYTDIYSSVEAYLEDFERMYTRIIDVTGVAPTVFRFAGGSLNVYNQFVYSDIIAEMVRRGFVFYDWNVAANDAVVGGITSGQVVSSVLGGAADNERIIVLMHDRNDNASTANALPAIIEGLAERGFTFEPLTSGVQPITFFTDTDRQ